MKKFIEVYNTDMERELININNIVRINEITEITNKQLNEIKKATDNLDFISALLGTDKVKETLSSTIESALNANCIIYLNDAWTNSTTSLTIYTNEKYEQIIKKIEEAQ